MVETLATNPDPMQGTPADSVASSLMGHRYDLPVASEV